MTRNPYHRLSVADKERYQRDRLREPAISCPVCEVQTTVDDLLSHLAERCAGRREPHHASRWIGWGEARSLGVPAGTLHRWVRRGAVRTDGPRGRRRYLLRDLARLVSLRRVSSTGGT